MRPSASAARLTSGPSCSNPSPRSTSPTSLIGARPRRPLPRGRAPIRDVGDVDLGDVSIFLVGTSTAVPYIQNGAVRGLAVTSSHPVQGLPDVPTFAEAGLPGVDVSIWFAVLVPGGTPPAIVRKLNADIAQVAADPEFKGALAARGFEARSSTPEQL